MRALPLSTTEGFVLSRVDGSTSVEDLSMISGIDEHALLGILDKLADLGVVELPWLPGRQRRVGKPPLMIAGASPPAPAAADAHFAVDAREHADHELDHDVQIPLAVRRRILDAFYAVEDKDFYALLGVARDADRKEIRTAYFELSRLFHPDAHFGKELGPFKSKMEAVFKALTSAYEALGKPKKRADYDEYLAVTEQTRTARTRLGTIDNRVAEVAAQRLAASRRAEEQQSRAEEAIRQALRPAPVPSVGRSKAPSMAPQPSNEERRARVRDRLRRGLKSAGSKRPPAPVEESTDPPVDTEQRRRSVIDGLKQSIQSSVAVTRAPGSQAQSHLRKAQEAERGGDPLLAAKELSVALTQEPDDPELLREYERVSKVVASNLADNYEKQALYEEKTSKWAAAGRSWARVADGRPNDAVPARRSAEALLKSSGNMHEAQKYAEQAVKLDGKNVTNLTVLARVYLAAGLKLNALRELEKAAQLAPNDELVNNLLRDAR